MFYSVYRYLKEWDLSWLTSTFFSYQIFWIMIAILIAIGLFILFKKWHLFFLGVLVGFVLLPFIGILAIFILFIMYLIWVIASVINIIAFTDISNFALKVVGFILDTVLKVNVSTVEFKKDQYFLFSKTMLFFLLLPYLFRIIVNLLEKLLYKFDSVRFANFFLKPLKYLSIDVLRYTTYVFAFYIYLLCYLWDVTEDMTAIKEGLLAFIIIDVPLFGVFSKLSKRKKRALIGMLNSLYTELERVQLSISANDLLKCNNTKSKVKISTPLMEQLGFHHRKRIFDKDLDIIYQLVIEIEASADKQKKGITFEDLYNKIDRIQNEIKRYTYIKG